MRRLSACVLLAAVAGCCACRPTITPITVKQQPGAVIVATLHCNY